MNERKVFNLVIYNVFNYSVREIYKKHKSIFSKYKSELNNLQKRIKDKFSRGSIDYYHTNTAAYLVDPFLLEKTGEDFNYWLIEINESIMGLIDILVRYTNIVNDIDKGSDGRTYHKLENINGKLINTHKDVGLSDYMKTRDIANPSDDNIANNLVKLKSDLNDYNKNFKSKYEIDKDFVQQGTKITCSNENNLYYINEWYKAIEFGVNNFSDISRNLELIVTTIDTLDKSVSNMKFKIEQMDVNKSVSYDNFMKENLSEADYLLVEQELFKTMRTRIRLMLDYTVIRFGNYKKQCEYTLLSMQNIKEMEVSG